MPARPVDRQSDAARPPGVERLARAAAGELPGHDHAALVEAARGLVAEERERLAAGTPARSLGTLADALRESLQGLSSARRGVLVPVINASGVIVHTNLGRATWPRAALEAAAMAAAQPVLLELDRASGRRGHRVRLAEEHLMALTGAEDALVTNNNAAAVALAVGLARRGSGAPRSRGVAVSRGELVEIGGGVRIPEIVRRAGARLIEVGTTNRTRVADYAEPLMDGRAALVLRVHRSNFRQEGFVEEPDPERLIELAHQHGVPYVDDLGSGAFLDTAAFGLGHEPMPRERLAGGADVVTFSGDKLVGGPQAGLLAGRAELIGAIRRDPLARAVRPDKVTLAAVAATLGLYRAGRATADIPVWRAIAADLEDLRARADRVLMAFGARHEGLTVTGSRATVGGGSVPGQTLPSIALRIAGRSPDRLLADLRRGDPCVIGRIEDDAVLLDLRTVEPGQDAALWQALAAQLAPAAP